MSILDNVAISKRKLHLLFLAGASPSMRGAKIGVLNDSIEYVLPSFAEISDNNPDVEIVVNVLEFSQNAKWQNEKSVPISDFSFKAISTGNENNIGKAFNSLSSYLRQIQHDNLRDNNLCSPIIILLSDNPSEDDALEELLLLEKNILYKNSIRIGIPIGDDADIHLLDRFAGKNLYTVHSIDNCRRSIHITALSDDQVNPKSFHTVLLKTIDTFGSDVIREKRIVNILADFGAFENKATKTVINAFVQAEYGDKVLALASSDTLERILKIKNYSQELINRGYQERIVNYVFESILFALGWNDVAPDYLDDEAHNHGASRTFCINGVSFSLLFVEGGAFTIGATPEQGMFAAFDEKPALEIKVNDYYLGETTVTQELWEAVMDSNPSHFKGAKLPVERVSWEDCKEFVSKLSNALNIGFRMPTEAEWEYAARGGKKSEHYQCSGSDLKTLPETAWFKDNSDNQTHEVAQLKPNELGFYDMSGNVGEWCSDWYSSSYANSTQRENPTGPSSGMNRVHRGGCWNDKPAICRVSKRNSLNPSYTNKLVGLRLAASKL